VVPLVRRIVGFNPTASTVLTRAADVARLQGNLNLARRYVDEIERMAKRQDDPMAADDTRAQAVAEAALIARDDHEQDHASELLEGLADSMKGHGQASDPLTIPRVRIARASVELDRNDPARALEDLRALLVEPERLFHGDALEVVDLTAIALAQQGNAPQAACLLGAVDRERDDCGLVIYPPDKSLRESAIRDTRSILKHNWDSAVAEGRTMTLDEAVVCASNAASAGHRTQPGTEPTDEAAAAAT
jgi:hypothetical protein